MTFEELQEQITSIGFSNSVVNSDTFKGLTINDQVDNEAILVPIKATNLFDIVQSLPNAFTRDQQARISSVLEAYMDTPIDKRGLEKKDDDQSFVDRLKEESNELERRWDKLGDFLGSTEFFELPEEQRELLRMQSQTMRLYRSILDWRLDLLTNQGHQFKPLVEDDDDDDD